MIQSAALTFDIPWVWDVLLLPCVVEPLCAFPTWITRIVLIDLFLIRLEGKKRSVFKRRLDAFRPRSAFLSPITIQQPSAMSEIRQRVSTIISSQGSSIFSTRISRSNREDTRLYAVRTVSQTSESKQLKAGVDENKPFKIDQNCRRWFSW